MGEIKSTLDLVMEKTRHLSQTPAEKAAQQKAEFEKKVNGLLVKYEKGAVTKDRFAKDLKALLESEVNIGEGLVPGIILDRIELTADNTLWFELLQTVFDIDTASLARITADYRLALEEGKATYAEAILKRLHSEFQIAGSAVVPHLEADPQWNEKRHNIESTFNRRLKVAKRVGY